MEQKFQISSTYFILESSEFLKDGLFQQDPKANHL